MTHTVRLNNYSGQIELRPNGKTVKQAVTQTNPITDQNESFNEKSVRVRLARIRELQGQVESMTVKNVQLYNSNREKDKEIDDLRNQNFKEWFKIANFWVKWVHWVYSVGSNVLVLVEIDPFL